jgi:ubiquinone/menaquinone biosynthesis C-methylase UbiE
MTTQKWYDSASADLDGELTQEIARLQSQILPGWDKEARILREFGLREGTRLLEVGCGPGYVTEQLARLVPGGSITAVDAHPSMLAVARERLAGTLKVPHSFVEASVVKLPFADASFDFVLARLLFQHIPHEQTRALAELRRVLQPGGKIVITEIDFEWGPLTEPPLPIGPKLRAQALAANIAKGVDVFVGRRLWNLLKQAGFENLDLEFFGQHSGNHDIGEFAAQLNPDLAAPLVNMGLLEKQDLDRLRAELAQFVSSKDPFYLRLFFAAVGQKPVGSA